MKHVRLIRHGESAANAGEPSLDHATIPLTQRGIEQANLVASSLVHAPDLIISSPFVRAQSTAMATVSKFGDVPHETWGIHEFTYLEPARCSGTTIAQRRDWVEAYWAKADPKFRDGSGAESFLDFISRAQSFLIRVAAHPAHDIVVFSHGQLINAVTWLIERNPHVIDGKAMTDWREYEIANRVPNCSGYILSKHQPDADWRVTRSVPKVGCLLLDDDPTKHAEQRMEDAGENRTGLRGCRMHTETAAHLSAREVCQVLRDVIFERHTMKKVGCQSWDEVYAGHFLVDVDGWRLSIYNDCDELDYCEDGVSPDGRRWSFDSGYRFGTDPIALLSVWEYQALEKLLKAL